MRVNYITDCYYVPEDVIKCYELPQCPSCKKYPTYNMNPCPFCGVELEYPDDVEVADDEKHRSDMTFFKGVSVEKKPIDKAEDEIEAFNI